MNIKKKNDSIQFALLTAIIILLNVVGQYRFFRLDLTEDNRYTLSEATVELLQQAEDPLLVEVYLEGDFPAGFQRLQRETKQMLDEFRAYNANIDYEFINPNKADTEEERENLQKQLQQKGIRPFRLQAQEEGGESVKTIFPGALLRYGNKEISVPLVVSQLGTDVNQQLNASLQNLEYALANGVKQLVRTRRPLVAFLQGHNELNRMQMFDLAKALNPHYDLSLFNIRRFEKDSLSGKVSLADQQRKLNRFNALIIAKPRQKFNEVDKYLIDQFAMSGGKVIWLIDAIHASMDSLSKKPQFMSYPIYQNLNINDMLFKYGVRINSNIVTDLIAARVADQKGSYPWIYFPQVMPQVPHPITKNINALKLQFPSSIDTVKAPGVTKTFLLRSSPYSRVVAAPHLVTLGKLYNKPDPKLYQQKHVPMAVLLEGKFTSLFKNRITPRDQGEPLSLIEQSNENKMVVIADGDIVRNQLNVVNPNMEKGTPLPLGYDQYTGVTYGNRTFMLNLMDYLLDDSGLISVRSKELRLRLLDRKSIAEYKLQWQLLNTIAPVGLVLLFGLVLRFLRKRKYAQKF